MPKGKCDASKGSKAYKACLAAAGNQETDFIKPWKQKTKTKKTPPQTS